MTRPRLLASPITCLAAALLVAPATAQDLYAITTHQFVKLDPSDPATVEPVGDLQTPLDLSLIELAYHPIEGRFFSVGIDFVSPTHRDYYLLAIDSATGSATLRGPMTSSSTVGHVESLEFIPTLGALVASHSDGGHNDFTSDHYATVATSNGAMAPLVTSTRDTDTAAFDTGRDAYLSLDPNGTDWSRIDLATGAATPAGPAIDTVGDLAHDPSADRIIGIDFTTDRTLLSFPLAGAVPGVGPAVVLGDVPGPELRAIAFGRGPARIGVTECAPASSNSTGLPAVLRAYGSTVATDNSVRVVGAQLPTNQFALLVVSRDAGSAVPPGSQGTLCLGGAIARYNGLLADSTTYGAVSIPVDLTQIPQGAGTVAAQPGETWRFQLWYRDVNPGQTSNFTDAVAISLQ